MDKGDNEDQHGAVCFMSNLRNCSSYVKDSGNLTFCVDSGCTNHLMNDMTCFYELLMLEKPIRIAVAKTNHYMEAIGVGNIRVTSNVHNRDVKCNIRNVLYVPSLRRNLLSVKMLEMANIKVVFSNGKVSLYDEGTLVGIGHRDNLYEISFKIEINESLSVETENHICNTNLR